MGADSMERVSSKSFKWFWILIGLLGAGTLVPVSGLAGVVLAPPQPESTMPGPGEDYPPAAFGQEPARPDAPGGFAARAVADMEESGADPTAPGVVNRAPAGLVFGKDASTSRPSPITPVSRAAGLTEAVKKLTPEPVSMIRRGVQEVALIAGDLGFFPKAFFVTRDIPVRLFVTGASKNTLCIMMDSFQVRKQVRTQKIEEITFTPGLPGRFRFYCPVNGMEGMMIVKEPSSMTDDTSGLLGQAPVPQKPIATSTASLREPAGESLAVGEAVPATEPAPVVPPPGVRE
jgi:hypothetical protein